MTVFAFTAAMLLTALAAYAANQMIVVGFIVVLLLAGLFIFQFQDHPAVQEWVKKVF